MLYWLMISEILMNLMDSSQNHVVDHFFNSVGEEWRPSPADEGGNTLWIQQATVELKHAWWVRIQHALQQPGVAEMAAGDSQLPDWQEHPSQPGSSWTLRHGRRRLIHHTVRRCQHARLKTRADNDPRPDPPRRASTRRCFRDALL